jgi:hypothetical protein
LKNLSRLGLVCAGLIALCAISNAATPAAYESLPGRKAQAEVPGAASYGIAHSQATDLAASRSALAECESRNSDSNPCEVTRLNDEVITSGRTIRARVDSASHPLYLWRYQTQTATVFLAGSIHVLKPSLYPLPPQFESAFQQADYLVVEVDTQRVSPAELQAQSMRFALLPPNQSLASVLPAPLYERLGERLNAYGMNVQAMARAKPAVVMNELVLARLTALGYLASYGLEQHFRARTGERSILELETLESQLRLLFEQPLSMQIQLLADTLDQEFLIEPLLADLLTAWLSGNDSQFLELFEQQAGDSKLAAAFNRQLLDDRNVGMADKIRTYLEAEGTYFVLAGAAHFIGPKGIVALLAQQGISGRRILSDEQVTLGATAGESRSAVAR